MNQVTGTIIKKLPFPWRVAGQEVTEVELRPGTLDDLLEAEKEAHPGASPTAFSVALACRKLLRAGTYTGPFVAGHFKSMRPVTWFAIRDAGLEVDALVEDTQPSQAQPI